MWRWQMAQSRQIAGKPGRIRPKAYQVYDATAAFARISMRFTSRIRFKPGRDFITQVQCASCP
jgi:hypothetical protein